MPDPSKDSGQSIELGGELRSWFLHAVATAEYLARQALLDEQTITGALLGAIAASHPLLQDAPTGKAREFDCFWLPYNTGTAKNLWSEARHGADFGLVVLGKNGRARFAGFQAKQSAVSYNKKLSSWTIDVRHLSKDDKGQPRAQMVALVESALATLLLNKTERPPEEERGQIGDLTWLHYVAYGPGAPICIPLSSMEKFYPAEQSLLGNSNEVPFAPDAWRTLFDVLRSVEDPLTPHWLDMGTQALFDSLLGWVNLLPVFVATDKPGWSYVPTNRRSSNGIVRTFRPMNHTSGAWKPPPGWGTR